jgi:phage gpG-like protein
MADLNVGLEGFTKLIEKLGELPKTVHRDMGYTILAMTLLVEKDAKRRIEENFHGVGTLAASITHKILKLAGLAVTGVVGTNLKYAAIHEFGGTIEPKNTKWLTIPFEGVKGRARDYTDTFFQWQKGAEGQRLILFQKNAGGKPTPLFVLVKKAEILARPYLNPALTENAELITQRINEALTRSLESVARK